MQGDRLKRTEGTESVIFIHLWKRTLVGAEDQVSLQFPPISNAHF